MDGRIQLPVIHYLQKRFGVAYVDAITEAGPVAILATQPDSATTQSMLDRLQVSIEHHQTTAVAVTAHTDCAGNPIPDEAQIAQLPLAAATLRPHCGGLPLIALWIDANDEVTEIPI